MWSFTEGELEQIAKKRLKSFSQANSFWRFLPGVKTQKTDENLITYLKWFTDKKSLAQALTQAFQTEKTSTLTQKQ